MQKQDSGNTDDGTYIITHGRVLVSAETTRHSSSLMRQSTSRLRHRPFASLFFSLFLSFGTMGTIRFLPSMLVIPMIIIVEAKAAHPKSKACPIRPPSTAKRQRPLVIGHRGASYNVPEHTLVSYHLALELGADFIEPDLVPTRDGVLIAMHSLDLNITTNVAEVFPDRFRLNVEHGGGGNNNNGNGGGAPMKKSGYLVTDFTLEEIKKLRVNQRVHDTPARSTYLDGLLQIPTFVELLDLYHEWNTEVLPVIERVGDSNVEEENRLLQRSPGIYIELKNPSWVNAEIATIAGNDDTTLADVWKHVNSTNTKTMEELFVETLRNYTYSQQLFFDPTRCNTTNMKFDEYFVPPLIVQCFESNALEKIRQLFHDDEEFFQNVVPPQILLVTAKKCWDPDFWFHVGSLSLEGVGPAKECLVPTASNEGKSFMNTAIEHGLAVHPWTERMEVEFVNPEFHNAEEELKYMFCTLKVAGIFAENVDLAVRVGVQGCETLEQEKKEVEEEVEEEIEQGDDSSLPSGLSSSAFCRDRNHQWLTGMTCLLVGLVVGGLTSWCIASKMLKSASLAEMERIPHDDNDLEFSPDGQGSNPPSRVTRSENEII
jgi:glycerophosphoryl diester phosphodiesterase